MARNECVVNAFIWLGKAGNAAEGAERAELIHAPCQNFMDIGLMSDIKNKPVTAGIEYFLYGERRFHNAKIGGQMSPGLSHVADQKFPNLPAELLILLFCEM